MSEYRLIMTGVVLVCGLAPLTLVWPALDGILIAVVLAPVALAVAGYLGREVWRELRFRAEMRALDRRDATRAADHTRVGLPR